MTLILGCPRGETSHRVLRDTKNFCTDRMQSLWDVIIRDHPRRGNKDLPTGISSRNNFTEFRCPFRTARRDNHRSLIYRWGRGKQGHDMVKGPWPSFYLIHIHISFFFFYIRYFRFWERGKIFDPWIRGKTFFLFLCLFGKFFSGSNK